MNSLIQKKEFDTFLHLLDDNNLLKYVIVIGSWAEMVYFFGNVLRSPEYFPSTKTLDVDFLIKNMRTPREPISLIPLASSIGCSFESDYISGVTKFYTPENLEIEFLINQLGDGSLQSIKTNLGVTAQPLRHFDILLRNLIEVQYDGMPVLVPSPEAFVVHKLIIHHDRGKKKAKDAQAIVNLWPFLSQEKVRLIESTITKKERLRMQETLSSLELSIS